MSIFALDKLPQELLLNKKLLLILEEFTDEDEITSQIKVENQALEQEVLSLKGEKMKSLNKQEELSSKNIKLIEDIKIMKKEIEELLCKKKEIKELQNQIEVMQSRLLELKCENESVKRVEQINKPLFTSNNQNTSFINSLAAYKEELINERNFGSRNSVEDELKHVKKFLLADYEKKLEKIKEDFQTNMNCIENDYLMKVKDIEVQKALLKNSLALLKNENNELKKKIPIFIEKL